MCWPFMDVELEEPPPKKEEKEKRVDVLVDDKVNLVPIPQPNPVYYTTHAPMQYYASPLMTPYNPPHTYSMPAVPVPPAAMPTKRANANGPWAYHGKTKAQIDEENRAIAFQNGAYKPAVYVPREAGPTQQYWCRELEGSYTLRNATECHEAGPGHWQTTEQGFPMYVRTTK